MYISIEKKREYQRIWISNRVASWLSDNGPCVSCGSDFDLELDHKDPTLKTLATYQIFSLSPRNPKRIKELENCQVLCKSCHRIKTNNQLHSDKGHGTYSMYHTYKCRCSPCRKANSDYIARMRHEFKINGIRTW